MLGVETQRAHPAAAGRGARAIRSLLQRGAPVLVALFATALFARTLGYGLYWDDYHHARPWALAEVLGTFAGPFDPLRIEPAYYRPLLVVTFAIDWALWGYNAWGYHLTNVLLHALASALVTIFARRITGSEVGGLVAGLVFAALPSNAATAIYISERSDAMVAICALSAALCVLAYQRSRRRRWLLAVVVAAALALGSKEIGVAVPLLVTLTWLFAQLPAPGTATSDSLGAALRHWAAWLRAVRLRLGRAWLVAAAPVIGPLAALALAYLLFRGQVIPSDSIGQGYSRVATSPTVLRGLASGVFWTFKAVPWEVPPLALPVLAVWAAGALVLRPASPAWRLVGFGAAWVALSCVPLAGVRNVEPRLLYLPEVGHAMVVAGLASVLAGAVRERWAAPTSWRRALAALTVCAALAWAGATSVSLVRAQDEFRPGGPKMLAGMREVSTNLEYRDRYPAYYLAQIDRELRAAGTIP